MNIPKNIIQAIRMIRLYRKISLEEIKKVHQERIALGMDSSNTFSGKEIAHALTGFGTEECIICAGVEDCPECIYQDFIGCGDRLTFVNIVAAISSQQLLDAFGKRADFIENLLKTKNWFFQFERR